MEDPQQLAWHLGRWVRQRLYLMGLVDLGYDRAERPVAMRLTLSGARLLGLEPASNAGASLIGSLIATPDFEVVLFPTALSYVITHVARAHVPEANLGVPYEEVELTTSDGLRLRGWYVPSRNRAAVISFPGRTSSQSRARMLARHGYGVLLFDRRGEGESDGDPNLFGWQGERDVHAAVAFLQRRPDVDPERIGGIGLSVGGEMMIEEAARNDELKAIVSEGAGVRSLREAIRVDGTEKLGYTWIFGVTTVGTALWTSNLPPRSLTDLSAEVTQPALFIHADPGQGGEILTEKYYEAAKGPKELWRAPGGHVGALKSAPAEYERRVIGFFDRTLGADR